MPPAATLLLLFGVTSLLFPFLESAVPSQTPWLGGAEGDSGFHSPFSLAEAYKVTFSLQQEQFQAILPASCCYCFFPGEQGVAL